MGIRMENLRASTFTDDTFATGEGYTKENGAKAIALPYNRALRKWVRLYLPETDKSTVVQVLDVGPYLWWDYEFLLQGFRPLVERYFEKKEAFPSQSMGAQMWGKISYSGKVPSSRAAIVLTPPVWWDLGVEKTEQDLRSHSVDDMVMEWFVDAPQVVGEGVPEWLRL